MSVLDMVMIGMYVVLMICTVIGTRRKSTWMYNKVGVALGMVGIVCSLYLIVRFPWQCLLWAVVGAIGMVVYVGVQLYKRG